MKITACPDLGPGKWFMGILVENTGFMGMFLDYWLNG